MKYTIAIFATEGKQAETTLASYFADSATGAKLRKAQFTDETAKQFFSDYLTFRKDTAAIDATPIWAVGEDGRVYEFYTDGRKVRTKRRCSLKKYNQAILDAQRKEEEEKAVNRKFQPILKTAIVEEPVDEISKEKTASRNAEKACYFIDAEENRAIPFRLRKAEKANRPLVVFFHGAGCFGSENRKQRKDFLRHCKKLETLDVNVVMPQAPYLTNASESSIEAYVRTVNRLIDALSKTISYDANRIYLIGVSFGGVCVWETLYCFPEKFACGIPIMGMLPVLFGGREKFDVHRLEKERIWIAHSENDRNVSISDDDFIVETLKKNGVSVRYTRWKRFGHGMSVLFCRLKPWEKWMMQQTREQVSAETDETR